MSVSTAPAAKTALVAIFGTATSAPTKVWRNRPKEDHSREENIYVGDVKNGHREWAALRAGATHPVEENYHVEVEVVVQRQGNDAEATELRCWAIVEQIESALSQNVTLSGLNNVQWSLIENFDVVTVSGNDGWQCSALLEVAVKARI